MRKDVVTYFEWLGAFQQLARQALWDTYGDALDFYGLFFRHLAIG